MSQLRPNITRKVQNIIFPTELWLDILDLVVCASIGAQQHCDYTNFPETILHLRAPWFYPSPIEIRWLRNLRLVCQTFNSLLKHSPYYTMKDIRIPIPRGTRGLGIYHRPAQPLLQRLLNEPSKSHRIVSLSVPGPDSDLAANSPFLFDFLCNNANSLPNLQSLSLGFGFSVTDPPWSRLNEAFPNLVSLVLQGYVRWTSGAQTVIFQKLEILDLGEMNVPDPSVLFPSLRHVHMHELLSIAVKRFSRSGKLESLVFRNAPVRAVFDWGMVPQLRLLGIPGSAVEMFPPTPPAHPLYRLHVFDGVALSFDNKVHHDRKEKELQLMKQALERFPSVSRITLALRVLGVRSRHLEPGIIGDFDGEELARVGLVVNHISREDHIVLDRVPLTTPRTPPPNQVIQL